MYKSIRFVTQFQVCLQIYWPLVPISNIHVSLKLLDREQCDAVVIESIEASSRDSKVYSKTYLFVKTL